MTHQQTSKFTLGTVTALCAFSMVLSACGGDSKRNAAKSPEGYWRTTELCLKNEAGQQECEQMNANDYSNYSAVRSDGKVESLDGRTECQVRGSTFSCAGQPNGQIRRVGDKIIIEVTGSYKMTLEQVSPQTFRTLREKVKSQRDPLVAALQTLKGRTIVLVEITHADTNLADGTISEYTQKATDVRDTNEWTDQDSGAQYKDYNAKKLLFIDDSRVMANDVFETKYELQASGQSVKLAWENMTKNGQLQAGFHSDLADQIIIEGDSVKMLSTVEYTTDNNGQNQSHRDVTTSVYQMLP